MSRVRAMGAKAREQFAATVGTAWGTWRAGYVGDELYARARPETVEITEEYAFRREISRNPHQALCGAPSGKIELKVPYDGHDYFTRQACRDVADGLARRASAGQMRALIGHLMLTGHGSTDLDRVLGLDQRYGSLPIHVPLISVDDGEPEELKADQHACVMTHEYAPDPAHPRIIPISVDVTLDDPDSLESDDPLFFVDAKKPPGELAQQVSFERHLILRMTVSIKIPKPAEGRTPTPKVSRVSLGWPTITSLRALTLRVRGKFARVRYNPLRQSFEWREVGMSVKKTSDGDDTVTFVSDRMFLLIVQPGELYRQDKLTGEVVVEIEDYLLSGVDARWADATGHLPENDQPKCVTHLSCDITLILDDAFTNRMVSPYQHLHFDEVIPHRARTKDIVTALKNRGFEVEEFGDGKHGLRAKRSEGPDPMTLWLLVEGRKFRTERRSRLPGDHTYTSKFKSGEIRVFIRGSMRSHSRELIREMNALQLAIRERFERLRSRR